ncbi:hypothetical protein WMY93_033987 [Mugilogobius chulae]|uniref:ribonuclease H n=1 Tax=Mugilogobius chulae TaxID=88201 RepID=A0AAW0MRV6_9GOBI
MEQFRLPSPLVLTGNISENWRRWEQRFAIYMTASGADGKDEKIKVAILLHALGEDALEVYNTLDVSHAEGDKKVADILAAFRTYCQPKKNTVFERHQFWAHPMAESVTIEKYVTELRQKSKDCEFGPSETDMIRDKIVFSLNDQRLKERLLREPNLTLERVMDICRAAETAKAQIQAMNSNTGLQEKTVHAVNKTKYKDSHQQWQKGRKQHQNDNKKSKDQVCRKCGKSHQPRQCPAYGVSCRKCGKLNHYAKMCESSHASQKKPVHGLSPEIDTLFIGTVNINHINTKQDNSWYADIQAGYMSVKFKLDTGAETNVLPQTVYKSLKRKARREKRIDLQLKPTKTVLVAYGGVKLKPEGTILLECSTAKIKTNLLFYVSNHSNTAILGKEACEALGLVKRMDIDTLTVKYPTTKEELLRQHASVFEGLGEFSGEYHIHVDPTVTPVIHGCRKIPLAVVDRLKDTLDDLLKADVIEKVSETTTWVNSLVVTEKRDKRKLRVCLDPTDLNKAILRQHYSIPTADEVLCKLSGKKIFTVLDEKDGYWQIKLDKESSLLCTFNTPWGRYRFKRLPFGIKSASEVFQQRNCETFGDIAGVHIIADDMIIAASTEKEHDEILDKVMTRAKEANVKFNKEKLQYKVNSVKYMGHVTSEGVKADSAKVKAIVNMPSPTDKPALQRMLGMIKYLSQYIPGEATTTAPLRQLLRKDTLWQWQHEHEEAVTKLKEALSTSPVLKFFDQKKPVLIQADASKDGLGHCAIRPQTLGNNPEKAIGTAPSRLQRMLLQLQRYDLNVIYTPGKELLIADTLSRATLPDKQAQMLMGRVLRSTLPSSSTILQPVVPTNAHSTLQHLQQRQRTYYNRGAKQLPQLPPGGTVHMQTERGWRPAIVTTTRTEPRSYNIVTPSGQQYRRNRRHLRKTPSDIQVYTEPDQVEDEQISIPATGADERPVVEQPPSPPMTVQTRSGRITRPPERFKDFVM